LVGGAIDAEYTLDITFARRSEFAGKIGIAAGANDHLQVRAIFDSAVEAELCNRICIGFGRICFGKLHIIDTDEGADQAWAQLADADFFRRQRGSGKRAFHHFGTCLRFGQAYVAQYAVFFHGAADQLREVVVIGQDQVFATNVNRTAQRVLLVQEAVVEFYLDTAGSILDNDGFVVVARTVVHHNFTADDDVFGDFVETTRSYVQGFQFCNGFVGRKGYRFAANWWLIEFGFYASGNAYRQAEGCYGSENAIFIFCEKHSQFV